MAEGGAAIKLATVVGTATAPWPILLNVVI